jgi:hypothetical protein
VHHSVFFVYFIALLDYILLNVEMTDKLEIVLKELIMA